MLCKPILNLFVGEYKGTDWRKKMNALAGPKNGEYKNNVKKLILDGIELYRG